MFSVYIFPVYIAWQAYVSNGKREKCRESITAQQGSVSKPKPVRIWPREDARWESWQMRLQNYKDLSYTKIIPRLAEQSCCHRVTSFKSIFHHDFQVPFLAQIPSQQTARGFTCLLLTLWGLLEVQVLWKKEQRRAAPLGVWGSWGLMCPDKCLVGLVKVQRKAKSDQPQTL